jgi:hypothetical protein
MIDKNFGIGKTPLFFISVGAEKTIPHYWGLLFLFSRSKF